MTIILKIKVKTNCLIDWMFDWSINSQLKKPLFKLIYKIKGIGILLGLWRILSKLLIGKNMINLRKLTTLSIEIDYGLDFQILVFLVKCLMLLSHSTLQSVLVLK